MPIRGPGSVPFDTETDDAAEACAVIRKSITELCHLDHGEDEAYLSKWLSNKTIENVSRWILQSHFFVAEEAGRNRGGRRND